MPLPENGTAWPPLSLGAAATQMAEHDAWFAGDPGKLDAFYTRNRSAVPDDHPSQYRGGVVGAVSRMFWGAPVAGQVPDQIRLHVPIPADLCQASTDLLFADPPQITAKADQRANMQIQTYLDDGLVSAVGAGANVGAALGGYYLRAVKDLTVAPHSFTNVVDADCAFPEFSWGRLRAVTFWWVLSDRAGEVVRQLERHELDPAGVGVVFHGVYRGTARDLGRAQPLADYPSSAGLAALVNADSMVTTGSPGLAVQYVRNAQVQRQLRSHQLASQLGRSDFEGITPLFGALDRVYSSWMRDIKLGAGRVIAPAYMLQSMGGPGKGVGFDFDREIFTGINAAPDAAGGGLGLTINQFAIRVNEHQQTAQQLVEDILRSAGYSAQTFGEDESGGAQTATEVNAKSTRSGRTRAAKITATRPALIAHVRKLLAMDDMGDDVVVDVQFPQGSQDTALAVAQTAQALRAAQAATTRTLVAMTHPDWDDELIRAEVAGIAQELADAQSFDVPAVESFGVAGRSIDDSQFTPAPAAEAGSTTA